MDFVVLPCFKALAALAPKASAKGLGWMEHNATLWAALLTSDSEDSVIGGKPEGSELETIAISPKPNRHHGYGLAWCATARVLPAPAA